MNPYAVAYQEEVLGSQGTPCGTPQGGLCKALHSPPYAKQKTMQSKWRKGAVWRHSPPLYFA